MQPILDTCALFMTMLVPTSVNWFRFSWKQKLWHSFPIHLIHQTWVPVTHTVAVFCLLYWRKKTTSADVDMSLKVHLAVSLFSVYRVCLSVFRAWILRLETEFLSRENTPTGWNEWNMDKLQNPSATIKWTPLAQLVRMVRCIYWGFPNSNYLLRSILS